MENAAIAVAMEIIVTKEHVQTKFTMPIPSVMAIMSLSWKITQIAVDVGISVKQAMYAKTGGAYQRTLAVAIHRGILPTAGFVAMHAVMENIVITVAVRQFRTIHLQYAMAYMFIHTKTE